MNKLMVVLGTLLVSAPVIAQDGGWSDSQAGAMKAVCYFFAVAIAASFGTKAQSSAATAALTGMARNPAAADKLFVPMILALALMESLVIFTLITIFLV